MPFGRAHLQRRSTCAQSSCNDPRCSPSLGLDIYTRISLVQSTSMVPSRAVGGEVCPARSQVATHQPHGARRLLVHSSARQPTTFLLLTSTSPSKRSRYPSGVRTRPVASRGPAYREAQPLCNATSRECDFTSRASVARIRCPTIARRIKTKIENLNPATD
jgi:hypothetical protein